MKKKKVWRYTCDHCQKSSGSASFISRHERHCTKNPNRICRMCARVGDTQAPIDTLIDALEFRHIPPSDLDWVEVHPDKLREVAHNCPACMLAALRQAEARRDPEDTSCVSFLGNFSWTTESKWWIEDYRYSIIPVGMEGETEFDREEWNAIRAKRFAKQEAKTA